MAITITFTNQKGGVGKSTLATNVAAELSKARKTLLIDTDQQRSALDFSAARSNFLAEENTLQVIGKDYHKMDYRSIRNDLTMLKKDYEFIVIDTPPQANEMTQALMANSDLCIIPTIPGVFDIWAMIQTRDDIVKVMAASNDKVQARVVLNQRDDRLNLTHDVQEALSQLGIPVARTSIGQRVAWRKCSEGLSVWERNQPKAKDELKALVEEILTITQGEIYGDK